MNDTQMERLGAKVGVNGAGGFRERYDKVSVQLERIIKDKLPTNKHAKIALSRLKKSMLQASMMATLLADGDPIDEEERETSRYLLRHLANYFETIDLLIQMSDEIRELKPFLRAELRKPEYEGRTLNDLYEEHTKRQNNGADPSLYEKALEAARALRLASSGEFLAVYAESVEFPLDKINTTVWNLLTEGNTPGQIRFNMGKTEEVGNTLSIYAYYAINFDQLEQNVKITKRLNTFDKRVYCAVNALYAVNKSGISLTQIHYGMGNRTAPNKTHLAKIYASITKMARAWIFIDNRGEADVYNYPHFIYDGALLPLERLTAVVNGQLSNALIHPLREPPLITFAKERKQITTVSVKLLQSPLNQTDLNLAIEDYLIERISHAKHAHLDSCRILYDTLYKRVNLTGKDKKKQRQRTPEKISAYLRHYVEEDFISRYEPDDDDQGVTVYFTADKKQ